MTTVQLTPGRIALAILMGTLAGPLYQVSRGIATNDLVNDLYWLDLLSTTLTAFAGTMLGVFSLIAGAVGLPILQGPPEKKEPPA